MQSSDAINYVWLGNNEKDQIFENLGKTLQINDVGAGWLTAWDENEEMRVSSLLQYHMHAPSEHTVDGELYDLEFHFVHNDSSGALSVLGVFFD